MRNPGKTKKLTDEQVAEVKHWGSTKAYTYEQIAKRVYWEYGISVSMGHVEAILKGRKRVT